ncbi:hypothetical protein ACPPVO_28570 [Dactylosporangium sp. McL0621]|uniref:hypothetical protein n=1 Tax=Dactylosporangium sp. McL0621 TaxID=3415678 RepID=UPI003CF5C65B
MDDQLKAMLDATMQRAGDDPLMAMLMQQMAAARTTTEADDEVPQLRKRLAQAQRIIARQRATADAADQMAAFVARVFGACPACWGLNRFCSVCLGDGGPGTRDLDPHELLEWVGPALRRAGLTTTPTTSEAAAERPGETDQYTHRGGTRGEA